MEVRLEIISVTDATEPVTLTDAKTYLGVTIATAEDSLITSMISTARHIAETYLSRDILPRQRRVTKVLSTDGIINLYNSPIASIDIVSISGQVQTISEGYELRGAENNPFVALVTAQTFSDNAPTGPFRDVVVEYTTSGLVDATIRQGILSILSDIYNKGTTTDMYKPLLAPHKILYI